MPLTTAQLATWASLASLVERLPRALDAQLQESRGLTHFEFGLLYALDAAPERTLRLSTLAGYASSTLSRLSRAFTRLERRGLVRRETDTADGRHLFSSMTPVRATPIRAPRGFVSAARSVPERGEASQ